MSYATQAQLTDRIGLNMLIALTDRADVPTGTVVAAVLNRALADTDAMIDGYLAGRYLIPLATTPALIADLAQSIAVWKLHVSEPEAKVIADYDQALKSLALIAKGTIILTNVAGIEPAARANSGVQIVDRERPFTEENMKGFI